LITGNRPVISVGSVINSSYNEGLVYESRSKKPQLNTDPIGNIPETSVENASGKEGIGENQLSNNTFPSINPSQGVDSRTKQPQAVLPSATVTQKPAATEGVASNLNSKVPTGKPNFTKTPQSGVTSSNVNAVNGMSGSGVSGNQGRQAPITRQPTYNVEQNRPTYNNTTQPSRAITPRLGNENPSRINEPSRRPNDGVKAPSAQPNSQPERRQPTFVPSGGDNNRRDNSFSTPSSDGVGRSGGGSNSGGSNGGGSNNRSNSGGGGSSSGARRK